MATESTRPIARPRSRGAASGPDRLTVVLLAVAAFLVVLALLASELRPSSASGPQRHVVVLRRLYETRVIETVVGPGSAGNNSVTQSVSSSGSTAVPASAPTTRAS